MTIAPYAGPAAAETSAVDFVPQGRLRVTPYVPREWRVQRATAQEFSAEARGSSNSASRAAMPTEGEEPLPSIGSFLQEVAEPDAAREDWPFHEAGERTTELSEELRNSDAQASGSVSNNAAPVPLPMWSEDDLMDIMPPPSRQAGDSRGAAHSRLEAGHAEADNSASEYAHTESAARALETLAQRVRSGELVVAGYAPELGDAAALAAALAALLGIRR